MLKKLIMFVFLITGLSLAGCAGMEKLPPEQRVFTYYIDVPNTNKDALYIKTMEWMSAEFRSSKAVIEYQDKEAGKIIGNGIMPEVYWGSPFKSTWDLAFKINIDIKDEKIRIIVDRIYTTTFYIQNAKAGDFEVAQKETLEDFKKKIDVTIDSFRKILSEKPTSDW